MPVPCPRCDGDLTESPAMLEGSAGPVLLETCSSCAGLWIDGEKLAAVCPTLADLPSRTFEVALLGRPGAGITACPRCRVTPYEFTVLDVAVDICTTCGGVWLDGDEYEGIVQSLKETQPTRSQGAGGPYRKAAEAAQTGLIDCTQCATRVPLARTYMWETGLVCAACHFANTQRVEARRRDLERSELEERAGLGLGAFMKGLFDLLVPECTVCGARSCSHR